MVTVCSPIATPVQPTCPTANLPTANLHCVDLFFFMCKMQTIYSRTHYIWYLVPYYTLRMPVSSPMVYEPVFWAWAHPWYMMQCMEMSSLHWPHGSWFNVTTFVSMVYGTSQLGWLHFQVLLLCFYMSGNSEFTWKGRQFFIVVHWSGTIHFPMLG